MFYAVWGRDCLVLIFGWWGKEEEEWTFQAKNNSVVSKTEKLVKKSCFAHGENILVPFFSL